MIKKIYDFLKKALSESEEENISNSFIKEFPVSKNSGDLVHEEKTDLLNESFKIQPCDEINPITGQISYGGVDVLGNPYGSDINNSIDNTYQSFENSFNNDFHNH